MKLSFLERSFVNSPLRRVGFQPWVARTFVRHLPHHTGTDVLEIGCGVGYGLSLLEKALQPNHLTGIDLDPAQIKRAKERWQDAQNVTLRQGDATKLPFAAQNFHTVVSFGALHHVPDWEAALADITRVLKTGGYLCLEEFYRGFLHFPLVQWLTPHPPKRFSHPDLLLALEAHGFELVYSKEYVPFVYGLVVARKR